MPVDSTAMPRTAARIALSSLSYCLTLVVALAIFWLYAGVIGQLVRDWWTDDGASYGFAMPIIAAGLTWSRRRQWRAIPAVSDSRGLGISALACLTLLIGRLGAEFFITRLSLILLAAGLIATFWGFARLRVLGLPLTVLATMIPVPLLIYNRVALPLQLLASEIAAVLVRWAGGTIYREGNILQLPNFTLGVAEACSGLHSLMALFVVALLMGSTCCTGIWSKVAVGVLAVPIAICMNVIRVAGTVFLAQWNIQMALGYYHVFTGWIVFVVSAVMMLYLARGLHLLLDR